MNYNNDECYKTYGYNQQWLNGDSGFESTGYSHYKKSLPQPPISNSQSVNDGFGHRSLPPTPISHQRHSNRQLPNYTSPTHSQFHGLPKYTSQIETSLTTFSSLFGMGKTANAENVQPRRTLFSLLSESKPQASQKENYLESANYNENYNYAYQSIDSTDELMIIEEKFDGDNNNMVNGRLRALPNLPVNKNASSLDYDIYGQVFTSKYFHELIQSF
jgi:hypothetical protein